jgi:rhodanese-related sulfurtransferase
MSDEIEHKHSPLSPVAAGLHNMKEAAESATEELSVSDKLMHETPRNLRKEKRDKQFEKQFLKGHYQSSMDTIYEVGKEPPFFKYKKHGKPMKDPTIFEFFPITKNLISPVIHKSELEKLLQKPPSVYNYFLIDTRSVLRATDYALPKSVNIPYQDILKGAINLTTDIFYERYKTNPPAPDANVICYSDEPSESEAACLSLSMAGYTNTFNYRGGCREWYDNEFKSIWIPRRKPEIVNEETMKKQMEFKEKTKNELSEGE